jgi:hypothetical protein
MMKPLTTVPNYDEILGRIVDLLERGRRMSARSVNTIMTTTYWEVGRQIVEGEQKGVDRAEYGTQLVKSLSKDLTARFGRGFGVVNLSQMRRFYGLWPLTPIFQTPPEKLPPPPKKGGDRKNLQTPSEKSAEGLPQFKLPWSHYVKLLSVEDPEARAFYEAEALRGGWTGPQLKRQIEKMALPDEEVLIAELKRTQRMLTSKGPLP